MVVNGLELHTNLSLTEWMQAWKDAIDEDLARVLPPADTHPAIVHEAMRYACLNGGKRLRAIFVLESCRLFGGEPEAALSPALALEAFHASTLVHDDLPCMDDDDVRRGMPATHIRFGEANALLAGNALLTLAMQWMAETSLPAPHTSYSLATELGRAGGSEGVIGGQIEDLAAEGTVPTEEQLLYIHTEKTARLISCACRAGALCGGAPMHEVDALGDFGLQLGLAFQILDDILDATQSSETLGKPAGSDEGNEKLTAVACWGLEESQKRAIHHTDEAIHLLEDLDGDTGRMKELATYLLTRSF